MSLARSTFMARRMLSTTPVQSERAVHPVFHKLKATQQMYQKDNGLVVSILGMTRIPLICYLDTYLKLGLLWVTRAF